MSQRKHFFYYGSRAAEEGRGLPDERIGEAAAARVRAAATLLYAEESDYAVMAEAILDELASENARLLAGRSPVSLTSLYLLLGDFCRRYETVTTLPPPEGVYPVAPVAHGLYFAVATAVHHLGKTSLPATFSMEESDPPALVLTAPRPSSDEEAAASVFGLDREGRLSLLYCLAEASGFSLSLHPGKETALRFSVPLRALGTVRLRAVGDPSLEAAFLLPLSLFHY